MIVVVAAAAALVLAVSAVGAVGTWSALGPANADVTDIALAPGAIYVATDDGGVYKTTDAGGEWTQQNTGLTETNVRALAIDPDTPATLYAATIDGVFRSTDAAGSWTAINAGLTVTDIGALAIDPDTPATLYAGGRLSGGIVRTTDGGTTWTASATGLTNDRIRTLAVHPGTPGTIFAGTFGGLFRSTNGGATWTAQETGLTDTDVNALAFDPGAPDTIYAATVGAGVFRSTDGGTSWTARAAGLPAEAITALAIDPAAPATLYAATQSTGVYRTTDAGATWTAFNAGLPLDARELTDVTLSTSGGTVLAGTDNRGVYSHTVEGGADDDTAPETTISSGPAPGRVTTDTTPAFGFQSSVAGSTFRCAVDGAAPAPCSAPHTVGPLDDGVHTFTVAAERAGTPDPTPATRSFVVDATPVATGMLTQKDGAAGCLTGVAHRGCATPAGYERETNALAFAPDGATLYAGTVTYDRSDPENPGSIADATAALAVLARAGDGTLSLTATHALDAGSSPPFGGTYDVVTSADGASVYATTNGGIAAFDRAADGTLTRDGGPALGSPRRLALSPDGTSLYATTPTEVAIYGRAPSGALTRDGGVTLTQPGPVAVSPDGDSVYVGHHADGPSDDFAALSVFDRGAGGALTPAGCFAGAAAGACTDSGFAFEATATADLAVTPDGAQVYFLTSEQSEYQAHAGHLLTFARAASGALTPAGCTVAHSQGVPPEAGCAEGGSALESATSLAPSPDGANLYLTNWHGNSLLGGGGTYDGGVGVLDRAPDGSLTTKPEETCCLAESAPSGGTGSRGLVGARDVVVSPDGQHVYTAAGGTPNGFDLPGALGVFDRDATGPPDDDDPPETTITAGPAEGTTIADPTPTLAFAADEAGAIFTCAVDGGAPETCTSPLTLGPLAPGAHSLAVFATDAAGNADPTPATRSFTVAAAPEQLVVDDAGDAGGAAAQEACIGGDSGCTLRAALAVADGDDQASTITFAAGLAEIVVGNGPLAVGSAVSITGPGARDLRVTSSGAGADPALFDVAAGAEAGLSGLTVDGFVSGMTGATAGDGTVADVDHTAAAIRNAGALTLEAVTIRDTAVSAAATAGQAATAGAVGGAVHNTGTLTVRASTLTGNQVTAGATAGAGDASPGAATATAVGGGIVNDGGTLAVQRSTISGNGAAASASGGAPDAATTRGAGIVNRGGTVTVTGSTLAGNDRANVFTGATATTSLQSTLLAGAAPNCSGPVTGAVNLEDGTTCGFAGSRSGADPALGALADNGGPTDTHAIGWASDALDAGDGTGTDQRRSARVVDFPGTPDAASGADVGAFERQTTAEGPPGDASCADGADNDADGSADGADPGCVAPATPTPTPTASPTATATPTPTATATTTAGLTPTVLPPWPTPIVPPPADLPDTRVLDFDVTARRSQKVRGRRVLVKASAGAQERVRIRATGRIVVRGRRYALRPERKAVPAGERRVLRLAPAGKRAQRKVKRALRRFRRADAGRARRRWRVRAEIAVVAVDAAGNRARERRGVRLT